MLIVIGSLVALLLLSRSLSFRGVASDLATGSTIATPTGRHAVANREVVEVVAS